MCPFSGRGNPAAIFSFEKYLFNETRFISYHLPVGDAQLNGRPKENMVVKNSCLRVSLTLGHLLALPPPGRERAPQRCWVMGVREEADQTGVSLQPVTSYPALHPPPDFNHIRRGRPLTIRRIPLLQAPIIDLSCLSRSTAAALGNSTWKIYEKKPLNS